MSELKGLFDAVPGRKPKHSIQRFALPKPPVGFVRSHYGILLRKNWFDATFHFCKSGSYDSMLVDYLNCQRNPFTFLDIGANQGLYSILAGKNNHCAKVFAFEPVASTFALLQTNLDVNNVADIVHPINAAVSLESGNTTIIKKPWHSGAATLRKLPRWFRFSENIATLGPDKLKTLIPAESDLIIKVDVEGHEKIVFEALVASGLLNKAKALFYEINRRWSQEHDLETLLREYGFRQFVKTSSNSSCDVLATR